jgi:8-oxo-dGTP pyrophosphatase MutT (NUDIX family)
MDAFSGYNRRVFRELLTEAFTAGELRRICGDTSEFREIRQLPQSAGLGEIADFLIEYSGRKLLLAELEKLVKENNPRQYWRCASQLHQSGTKLPAGHVSPDDRASYDTSDFSLESLQGLVREIVQGIAVSGDTPIALDRLLPIREHGGFSLGLTAGVVTLLQQLFDPLAIDASESWPKASLRPRSEIAGYFLQSLGQFLDHDLPLVSNWEREGAGASRLHQVLDSGAQFLYSMERKRQDHDADMLPIRQLEVVVAIIKARRASDGEPVVLMRLDDDAGQYQAIGGKVRPSDRSLSAAVKRELIEEIDVRNQLTGRDYRLNKLTDLYDSEVSNTTGIYTNYHLHIFHVTIDRPSLHLGHLDKWVSLSDIRNGKTQVDGCWYPVLTRCLTGPLGSRYPRGLEDLPFSLTEDVVE